MKFRIFFGEINEAKFREMSDVSLLILNLYLNALFYSWNVALFFFAFFVREWIIRKWNKMVEKKNISRKMRNFFFFARNPTSTSQSLFKNYLLFSWLQPPEIDWADEDGSRWLWSWRTRYERNIYGERTR